MAEKKITLNVDGMVCGSCEKKVRKAILSLDGIVDCKVRPGKVNITFDDKKLDKEKISAVIEKEGYPCSPSKMPTESKPPKSRRLFLFILFFLGGVLLSLFYRSGSILPETSAFPELSGNVSYLLLFGIGLLTGFHCIGMCGGFVLSYAEKASAKSHLFYASGKTLSYTIIGGLFGLFGSFIAFTPKLRGTAALLSGLFLVFFGLKMLGIIQFRLNLPSFGMKGRGPLGIGLLNGLMIACGPLQAIYIYAAGTGSVIRGAASLFAFGLGTLPALLGFGTFASTMSKMLANRIARASGVLVIILGLGMANTGLALAGTGYDVGSLLSSPAQGGAVSLTSDGYQEISMEVIRTGYKPNSFVLEKGVPVRWKIDAKELNYCNDGIIVPWLGLEFDLTPGEQVIEFVPEREGRISWSCWMGMMPGSFLVTENPEAEKIIENPIESVKEERQAGICPAPSQEPSTCSCGGV